ncbi:hypothetical protein TCON_1341 [Astathelohania contejeani]|uniref:Uncharacterized protein n=1 Tax=Astathelohania contejeani TaxID=164912 RepID=A0ABQ7HZB0_9MICR|nr:hypothetical protein TCON_1341 [Thelohania contejeani]
MIINRIFLFTSNHHVTGNNFQISNNILILLIHSASLPTFTATNPIFQLEIESNKIKNIKSNILYFHHNTTLTVVKSPPLNDIYFNDSIINIKENNIAKDSKITVEFRKRIINKNKSKIENQIRRIREYYIKDIIYTPICFTNSFYLLLILLKDRFNIILNSLTINLPLKFIINIMGIGITNKQNHIIKTYTSLLVIILFKMQKFLIEKNILFLYLFIYIYLKYICNIKYINLRYLIFFLNIKILYQFVFLAYFNLVQILGNVIDILRGKNYNVLKMRYDNIKYSTDKIIISTIMLSIGILILFNIIEYYFACFLFFIIIEICNFFVKFGSILLVDLNKYYKKYMLIKNDINTLKRVKCDIKDRIKVSFYMAFALSKLRAFNNDFIKKIITGNFIIDTLQ